MERGRVPRDVDGIPVEPLCSFSGNTRPVATRAGCWTNPHGCTSRRNPQPRGAGLCGADQIGGGSEECKTCGEGEVPNEDGTDCESCPNGESGTSPGECAATTTCSNDRLDNAAWWSLTSIPKDPWEEVESYTCDINNDVEVPNWLGSSQYSTDVCELPATGWSTTSAYGHSHPHFRYPRDRWVICDGRPLRTKAAIDKWNKDGGDGSKFGPGDKSTAKTYKKPMYLVVPKRDRVWVYRIVGKGVFGGDRWDAVEVLR